MTMTARGVRAWTQSWAYRVCFGAEGYQVLVPLLLLCDGLLTALIVQRVPYTEIDFTTYVGQARLFLKGERVYTRLDPVNGSGPCVYPAGHLYVYAALASLSQGASDLVPAQLFFAALYLATFALVAQLYRLAGAPPILLVFLVLSKRLHSIFVLRLFNDPVCMFWVYGSIYLLCARRWRLACVVYRCVYTLIQSWSQYQNERAAFPARAVRRAVPCAGHRPDVGVAGDHRQRAGNFGRALPPCRLAGIRELGIRLLARLFIQVDGQLAVLG